MGEREDGAAGKEGKVVDAWRVYWPILAGGALLLYVLLLA